MASTDEDSGHHLAMTTSGEQSRGHKATSGEQSRDHMATSSEQSGGHMDTSGEQSGGHMDTSSEQPGGHMDTSGEQSRDHMDTSGEQSGGHMDTSGEQSGGHMDTSSEQSGGDMDTSSEQSGGHMAIPDVDSESSDVENLTAEEDVVLLNQPPVPGFGDRPSGGSQVANTLNIITEQTRQGTLGRDTLDLRTDEAKKIFLPTEPYKDMKRKLKAFGHVTICGASGEGKTTMALVLGSKYRCKGYEVVFVENIEKFDLDHCLSRHPRVFLIVDDMFGTVGTSANTSQVKSFLDNLLLHLEQKQSAEKLQSEMHESYNAVGKSRKKVQSQPEFQTKDSDAVGKSRKKVQSQPECHTKDIRVIFTSKSYNFHDGLAKLQYEGFKLFNGQTVMDLTTQDKYWLSDKEKKTIFEQHRNALGDRSMQHIPDYSELEICSNIFGFPLICKLCFELSSFYKNAKSFFKEPLFYLRLELKLLLEERNDRSAILVLMLLCEDKLDLTKLDSEGEDKEMDSLVKTVLQLMSDATRSGMYKAAKSLRGTFFTRGDTVGFAHSSIYDACACALYNISPIFVLKHCSDDFLFERVQGDKVEETKVDDHLHLIYVSENYDDLLTTRFAQSIKQGQFSKSVTHPILKQDATVFKLLNKLQCDRTKQTHQHNQTDSEEEPWFHKKKKGQCFLYWAVLGHNARLVTDIEHTTGEEFTQGEISEAMEGCAQSNNVTALKWLFNRSEKHDHQLTLNRLLLVAAESGSSDVLVYLLQEGADINTRDKGMQNIFHLVCKSGMEKTLKVLLTRKPGNNVINSVDVNGRTPVMVAAHTGSEGCFKLLQTISNLNVKDKYSFEIIHLACIGGTKAIVQHVLSPSNINSRGRHGCTPVMVAAVSGHQSVFGLLVSNQADLTLVDTDSNSLLHLACRGGNTAIVQHVLSPSNINSRGIHGYTPVMMAAVSGHQSVFGLLVSNQADLTLVDTDSNSLLHLACRGGNTAIVQHVLSPSNINSRGIHGYTPVMMAAVSGHQSVFGLLVSNQADLTLVDTDGNSLLHLACRGGNTAIVQHVLSPSNINSRGIHGYTPVMVAAVNGHQSVFDLLFNQADLKLVDANGNSLLHLACLGVNTAIVQHVLFPSNINSRGEYGWTPVMVAAVNGHQSVFDLLVSNQADLTLVDTDGNSLLHLACRGGNTAIVQHVLSPSNINSRGIHGYTPVMVAAFSGHQSVFDLLVSNQADLTLVDADGDSLLHLACQGGNTAIVQHILSPSNINSRGIQGSTPVMVAAVSGHQSVFELLVSNQADLTLVDTDGDNLLHLACHGGNTAIVQHVLPPSNINSRGIHGYTPVMVAAVRGHQSVFDLLVSNQADLTLVDTDGDSLLHLACHGGNTAIVQHVLSPSNINSRGINGCTPVMVAAVHGHQSVFDLLVSNQADLTLVSTSGDSLLHHACRGGNTAIVQHVLCPSNVNSRGSHGYTPLIMAAIGGHQSVFDLLLSNQADLTLVNADGNSLLHHACRGGNTAIVQHVLSPSNINSRGIHGYTPVIMAAFNGHKSVFDFLVSNQADLTLVNADGNSLLHHACRGGNTAIVQHVLSPSNINSRGIHGYTPIMVAAVGGHQSVFDLLLSNQADLTLVNTSGHSLLHLACRGGNTAIILHVLSWIHTSLVSSNILTD